MNPITRNLETIAGQMAVNRAAFTPEQESEVRALLQAWNAHVDAIRVSDPTGIDLPSCFDCCNFECGGITDAPFCKVSEQVDVRRFFLSSGSKRKDVRQCPGFKEDR